MLVPIRSSLFATESDSASEPFVPTFACGATFVSSGFLRGASAYGLALLFALASVFLRYSLIPLLGISNPYHTAWIAVVFCSWYCGLGPSIVAALVIVIGLNSVVPPPFHAFYSQNSSQAYAAFGFLLFSAAIIALGESNRRTVIARDSAERKLKMLNEQLAVSNRRLGERVSERTAELWANKERLASQTDTVRSLSARLLRLQDDERRRFGRELHDSVGQSLAAMNMSLGRVLNEKEKLSPTARKSVQQVKDALEQVTTEIRTISYLLHPPMLDELGLEPALSWYVDGFSKRSKIDTSIVVSPGFERLDQELETAIFRIVQECLTNVHRHSESQNARVTLSQENGCVHCEVTDNGKGMPNETQEALDSKGSVGVGLRGMRERVNQLGGSLQIQSKVGCTTVAVTMPKRAYRAAAGSA